MEMMMGRLIDELVLAMNDHDVDRAAGLMHENYRSEQPAHPDRAFVGRAQMRANWAAMFAGIPDFRAELLASIDDGDVSWTEWAWTGSREDGRPVAVRGVAIFTIRAGFIVAGRLYMEDVDAQGEGIDAAVRDRAGRGPAHA
jgi:ketosteroid isomerase-like protein